MKRSDASCDAAMDNMILSEKVSMEYFHCYFDESMYKY